MALPPTATTAISMKDAFSEIGKSADPSSMSMSTLCREAEAMAAPNVVHSNYVPADLQRHLQFLQFNAGMFNSFNT